MSEETSLNPPRGFPEPFYMDKQVIAWFKHREMAEGFRNKVVTLDALKNLCEFYAEVYPAIIRFGVAVGRHDTKRAEEYATLVSRAESQRRDAIGKARLSAPLLKIVEYMRLKDWESVDKALDLILEHLTDRLRINSWLRDLGLNPGGI